MHQLFKFGEFSIRHLFYALSCVSGKCRSRSGIITFASWHPFKAQRIDHSLGVYFELPAGPVLPNEISYCGLTISRYTPGSTSIEF